MGFSSTPTSARGDHRTADIHDSPLIVSNDRGPLGAGDQNNQASVNSPRLLAGLELAVAELYLAVLINGERGRGAQMLLDVEPRQRLGLEAAEFAFYWHGWDCSGWHHLQNSQPQLKRTGFQSVPTNAIRELLKRSSSLVWARTKYEIVRGSVRTNYQIVNELAAFGPSPGPITAFRARADLALQSAQQAFPLICSLAKAASQSLIAPRSIEALFPTEAYSNEAAELAALFKRYGSDKSTGHDYHVVYASLLGSRRNDPLRLFEVGLGTYNRDILSHMGRSGKPGASLRAFRDFLPNAQVFGADIDKRILFNDDRIRTYYVDQTRLDSFDELYAHLSDDMFDLVIDDGLHAPNANIATMLFALKVLRPSGFFIVEDIHSNSIPIWQVVAALLPEQYSPKLVQAKGGLLFMIQKPD
jgi:SAM-dependent methyltransferase